jgi:FkbM family methyltransferase
MSIYEAFLLGDCDSRVLVVDPGGTGLIFSEPSDVDQFNCIVALRLGSDDRLSVHLRGFDSRGVAVTPNGSIQIQQRFYHKPPWVGSWEYFEAIDFSTNADKSTLRFKLIDWMARPFLGGQEFCLIPISGYPFHSAVLERMAYSRVITSNQRNTTIPISDRSTGVVIFDVGANQGTNTIALAHNPLNTIYAFEPTPYLLETFLKPISKIWSNYIVIPTAVSDFNGEAQFNIAGQADWGCSSLHGFSEDLNQSWPGRTDFVVTDKISVLVQRADKFIEENAIEVVDYLHCDTQGSDLAVLRSFGDKINILRSGVVEAYRQNPLYKGVDNSLELVTSFLVEMGFTITHISENDVHSNEVNVYFQRKL